MPETKLFSEAKRLTTWHYQWIVLFNFTGKSGNIVGDLAPLDSGPIGPISSLPSNWVVDRRRFYDLGEPNNPPEFELNFSRALDPLLAPTLHALPDENGQSAVLAFRNLKRGVQQGLPSGQDVANAMRVVDLSSEQLSIGPEGEVGAPLGMHEKIPLWYYVLKEAEQLHGGQRLGPVGSTIVAETFLGLVQEDQNSFLWRSGNWQPDPDLSDGGKFTMTELVRFVDDINPVG